MSLLFNMLSRFVIAFLPRSKYLLISWLQSPSAVFLEPKKRTSLTVSIVSPSIYQEVMGLDAMIFIFWTLNFKPTFSLSSFTFIKRLFSSSSLSAIKVVSSAYLKWLIFHPGNLDSSLCFFHQEVIYFISIPSPFPCPGKSEQGLWLLWTRKHSRSGTVPGGTSSHALRKPK